MSESEINVSMKIRVSTSGCTMLVGYSKQPPKEGFKTTEDACAYSDMYGINKTTFKAHAYFGNSQIAVVDNNCFGYKTEAQAISALKKELKSIYG